LYASALTLLQRDDGDSASYLEIAEALQLQGDARRIDTDLRQLYRRIAFSILVANRDDHLRNHGFLRGATGWHLAPAFDVNPSPEKVVHALAIDELDAHASLETLRSTARFYRLSNAQAARIERDVRDAVATWRSHVDSLALPADEVDVLSTVFEPGAR
jgi:serine/threonine-protein kinase HipA